MGVTKARLGENDHLFSLNSSAFIENLSSSEGARTCVRTNHAKNNAQKGCIMQLNGITLTIKTESVRKLSNQWTKTLLPE